MADSEPRDPARERLYMDSPSLQVLCLMDVGSTAYVYPAFEVAYVDAGP